MSNTCDAWLCFRGIYIVVLWVQTLVIVLHKHTTVALAEVQYSET